jgi:hypothetical protein
MSTTQPGRSDPVCSALPQSAAGATQKNHHHHTGTHQSAADATQHESPWKGALLVLACAGLYFSGPIIHALQGHPDLNPPKQNAHLQRNQLRGSGNPPVASHPGNRTITGHTDTNRSAACDHSTHNASVR